MKLSYRAAGHGKTMMLLPIPTPRPRLKEYYRDVNHKVSLP